MRENVRDGEDGTNGSPIPNSRNNAERSCASHSWERPDLGSAEQSAPVQRNWNEVRRSPDASNGKRSADDRKTFDSEDDMTIGDCFKKRKTEERNEQHAPRSGVSAATGQTTAAQQGSQRGDCGDSEQGERRKSTRLYNVDMGDTGDQHGDGMSDEWDGDPLVGEYWDDIYGTRLNAGMFRKARADEIRYLRAKNVYKKVPLAECKARTGRMPIGVKWVDTDKNTAKTGEGPNYRSRLVAQEFKLKGANIPELYASTPPLEALKILLAMAAS